MLSFFKDINNLLFLTFNNLILLFKNIFHWTISRILIFIFSLATGILFAIPFLLLSFILMFLDPVNRVDLSFALISPAGISIALFETITSNIIYIIFNVFFLLLGVLSFIVGYSYKIVTTTNLYISYIKGEKLPYMSNIYFNFTLIKKFFYVLSWISFYLIFPIISFLIIFFIISYFFGGFGVISSEGFAISQEGTNYFNIVLIFFLLHLIYFIYLSFRLSFSYIIMLDQDKGLKAKEIVKLSYKKTKKITIFIKFLIYMFIYSILISIVELPGILITGIWYLELLFMLFLLIITTNILEMFMLTFYYGLLNDGNQKTIDIIKE